LAFLRSLPSHGAIVERCVQLKQSGGERERERKREGERKKEKERERKRGSTEKRERRKDSIPTTFPDADVDE